MDDGLLGLMSHLSSSTTFSEVRQKVKLLNPFDGREYVMSAVYDGDASRVKIKDDGGVGMVGHVAANDGGTVGGRVFRVKEERWWAASMVKASINGETRWHQYPGGAYLVIAADGAPDAKIYQGARAGKFAGLDAFEGCRTIVFVPRDQGRDYRRDLFLFYSAMAFYQEFSETIENLPYCLNEEEARQAEECPAWIETY